MGRKPKEPRKRAADRTIEGQRDVDMREVAKLQPDPTTREFVDYLIDKVFEEWQAD